jgi:phosphomannomutase/phosphoglucomutase
MSFLSAISAATRSYGASLGIGIDGDGDRLGVVDDQGRELFSDKLGLLLARWMSRAAPRRSVVVDVKSTSLFLDDKVLAAAGWVPLIWKTGHSHIKEKVSSAGAIAGFEKSGHFFFAPPYGRGYDDALLSASVLLQMLEEEGRPLSVLADELPQTWQSPTLSVYCSDADKYKVVQEATEQYVLCRDDGGEVAGSRIRDILLINGVRFSLESGAWGVIRASSNKPCIVLVAESRRGPEELRLVIDHMKAQLARTGRVGAYEQDLAPRSPASISSGGSA